MDKTFIKDLLNSLKFEAIRFRMWCVLLFILVAFAPLGVGYFWPNTYKTDAMLYADETNIIEPLLSGRNSSSRGDRSAQAGEILYTRQIMEKAAEEAGLISANSPQEQVGDAVQRLRKNLEVVPETDSHFRLTYTDNDPDRAFRTLNSVINVFIQHTARQKREESLGAFNFIDSQVQTYKRQLEEAEKRLKEFRSQNTDGTEQSVNARINELRNQIESLNISIEETQSRIASIKAQLQDESQYQMTKGKVEELRERRQALDDRLEQLLLSYQESYPDVISVREQISSLDQEIEALEVGGQSFGNNSEKTENPLYEELRKQLSNAEVELQAQQRRLQSLIHLQEQEFERAERVAANQAELSELTRDYNVTRDVYEEMLQRKESARLSMALDVEGEGVSYKIQDPARFPLQPSGLKFIHFAIAGPFLGFMAPIGLLFLYILLDPRIRSATTLQQQLPEGIELMGVIPHYHTPLGERLLRKDMLLLLGLCVIAMAVYVSLSISWYDLKN